MPRPRTDNDAVRESLLAAADKRLRRLGTPKFSVTDLAEDCKMSQSNVYRFFPNKASLMAALVDRWFEAVEAELVSAIGLAPTWQDKLHCFVQTQLILKRTRFEEDLDLFRANLALASEHMGPVGVHVGKLRSMLETVLEAVFAGRELSRAVELFEDATQIFRDPFFIARYPERCTPERAEAVVRVLVREFEDRL